MVTLQQMYDRLDDLAAGAYGVPKTGQTTSWASGDDGEYRAGVSADPRFTDNGDGTVKDNLTGLLWLQDAGCFGARTWIDALSDVNTLADGSCGLTDGSVAGDWRLPNVRELNSLIDYGQYDPALPPGHPFSGVVSYNCWSSTSVSNFEYAAWYVHPNNGLVYTANKGANSFYFWPVRGGQ
jgi:hypothetical protein